MNKSVKGLIIGGAAVVVLAAATVVMLVYDPEKGSEVTQDPGSAVQTIYENENAEEIVVKTAEHETRFVRTGDDWTIDGYSVDDLDPSKVISFVSDAVRYSSDTVIRDPEDLGEYGLETPEATVTVSGGGTSDVIEIGGRSAVEDKYFAMYNGIVFTIPASQYTKLISEPSYFTEFTRVSIDPNAINEIRIQKTDRTIDLYIPELTRMEGNVWYMREPYEMMANDTFIDSDILEQIGSLTMSRHAEALGEVRAVLTVTAGSQSYEFRVGEIDGGSVMVGYNGGIYKESSSLLGFIDADLFNYVNKLVSYVNVLDISEVIYEYDGSTHSIEVSGDNNDLSFRADGADRDASETQDVYRETIGVSANAFYDSSALGDTILKVTFRGKNGAGDTVMEYRAVNEYNAATLKNGEAYLTVGITDINSLKTKLEDYFSQSE